MNPEEYIPEYPYYVTYIVTSVDDNVNPVIKHRFLKLPYRLNSQGAITQFCAERKLEQHCRKVDLVSAMYLENDQPFW